MHFHWFPPLLLPTFRITSLTSHTSPPLISSYFPHFSIPYFLNYPCLYFFLINLLSSFLFFLPWLILLDFPLFPLNYPTSSPLISNTSPHFSSPHFSSYTSLPLPLFLVISPTFPSINPPNFASPYFPSLHLHRTFTLPAYPLISLTSSPLTYPTSSPLTSQLLPYFPSPYFPYFSLIVPLFPIPSLFPISSLTSPTLISNNFYYLAYSHST